MRERVLDAGDRKDGRMRPGGDEDLRAAQALLPDGDRMGVDEPSLADKQSGALGAKIGRLRITATVDDALGAIHGFGPVDPKVAHVDPKLAEALSQLVELRDPDQGLLRDSPVMQSRAAEGISLDDGDLLPQRERHAGGGSSCGTAAQNDKVERRLLAHRTLRMEAVACSAARVVRPR